jgi:thiamine monophosphate kinase
MNDVTLDANAQTALAEFRGTPEQATAALNARAAAYKASTTPTPTTPSTAARVQLDALTRNADFRSKLDAGDPATRRQFSDLCAAVAAGDAVADALAGGPEMPADHIETTVSGELSSNALRREVEALQSRGVGNDIIKQMVTGSPVSAAEKEAAVRLRSMRMGNSDFVKLYLGGDAAAGLEMTLLSTIIAAEVAA